MFTLQACKVEIWWELIYVNEELYVCCTSAKLRAQMQTLGQHKSTLYWLRREKQKTLHHEENRSKMLTHAGLSVQGSAFGPSRQTLSTWCRLGVCAIYGGRSGSDPSLRTGKPDPDNERKRVGGLIFTFVRTAHCSFAKFIEELL